VTRERVPYTRSVNTFRPGAVLRRSLAIWARNFAAFFCLSLLVYLPAFAGVYVLATLHLSPAVTLLVSSLLCFLAGMVTTAAITQGTFAQLDGQHVPFARALARGLAHIPEVLGVGFLIALVLAGLSLVLVAIVGLIATLVSLGSRNLGILTFVLLVTAPLAALLACYWVAVPAAAVEHAGGIEALRRSARLTEGLRSPLAGLVLLFFGLGYAITWTCARFLATAASATVVTMLLTIALSALAATASAVAYHDLRVLKEHVSTDDLARVFDPATVLPG
jgi:hypothetical protein